MHVLLNGRRVSAELAQIPLDDYLTADGLAVTARLYRACPLRLDAHLRILASALATPAGNLSFALNPRQVSRELAELVRDERLFDGLATVAVLPAGRSARTAVFLRENLETVWSRETRGAAIGISGACYPRNATAARLPFIHAPWPRAAAAEARARNLDGGLVGNALGEVLFAAYADGFLLGDAASSAVFAVVDRALVTPDPEKNRLPANLMRNLVEETAARLGVIVYHEPLTPETLARATEIFTADSAREIFPLRYCQYSADAPARTFADWPTAQMLQTTLQKRIEKEISMTPPEN